MIYYTKSNIKQNLHKRKKKKILRAAEELGPLTLSPRALNPLSLPSLQVADGEVPPVSSFSLTRGGSATTPAVAGGVSAHAKVRIGSASTVRLDYHPPNTLYSVLSTSATRMAGGRHSRS